MHTRDQILLFPTCDQRGWVCDALTSGDGRYSRYNAENVYFAWLLELPAGVDPVAAAKTLLDYAGLSQDLPEIGDKFKYKLHVLLLDLIKDNRSSSS